MNTTSQYMDKQIMDLSNSHSVAATGNNYIHGNNDFIDFMNRQPEKKEDIVPSYDFMPIRPSVGSSSPTAARSSNFDSDDGDATQRGWVSADSHANTSLIRRYGSLDADEPSKFMLGKNHKSSNEHWDVSLVSEIDKTMKKYMDNVMHALDSMSARFSQLETRTRNLENSIDDLNVSVGNNNGNTDGKMRLLENVLREVQAGVLFIKDKQEILEARLDIAKLQIPKVDQAVESNMAHADPAKTGVSSSPQQFSAASGARPLSITPLPNVPPPPQQNLQPPVQLPNQFPQNQVPSVPQPDSYFPSPNQTPENQGQQYQMPPPQQPQPQHQHQHQHQPQPAPPTPQHQYQTPLQQYTTPPPQSQPHSSISAANPSIPQTQLSHNPEETSYMLANVYPPPGIHLTPSHPSAVAPPHLPPSQPYYGPNLNAYDTPSSKPGLVYSGPFAPSSGHGEPYHYINSSLQHGSGSPIKTQQLPPPVMGQSGGAGYPQLRTARMLPQALPTASSVGGGSGSGSGGSGNRVPIDDVVDQVTGMGFPRDQVRATVRRLTENGQAVDLNVVLDKLMNDREGQAPQGWFGR